jgi:NDP-sugar pyrophosphorylase family protein
MPVLEILLRRLKLAGINEIVMAVGHLSELLRAFFNDGHRLGLNISYSYEEEPLGTAGPLAQIDDLNETFLVSNGDILTTLEFDKLIRFHEDQKSAATIAVHQRKVNINLGVIEWNGAPEVRGYVEKPTYEFCVSMGIYVFEPHIIQYIPRGEYLDFPDLVHKLIKAGERVVGYSYDGYWEDLGRPDDYEQAMQDFEKMRAQFLPER